MKPIYTLHKLPEGFIVTSDEDLEKGDLSYHHVKGLYTAVANFNYTNQFKVIAQQNQIDFSALSEKEQKKIGWFDIDSLGVNYLVNFEKQIPSSYNLNNHNFFIGFEKGFQKAQELLSDRKFTETDLWMALNIHYQSIRENSRETLGEIIESVSQKSWKVELEMIKIDKRGNIVDSNIPNLTNDKIKITKIIC
jgi:hypothetical protein